MDWGMVEGIVGILLIVFGIMLYRATRKAGPPRPASLEQQRAKVVPREASLAWPYVLKVAEVRAFDPEYFGLLVFAAGLPDAYRATIEELVALAMAGAEAKVGDR